MTIYYVDGTADDDSKDGTSEANAKKTLQAGVDLLAAGDTLRVLPTADYAPITIGHAQGGTSFAAPTTIIGWGGDGSRAHITSSTDSTNLVKFLSGTITYFVFQHFRLTHTATTRGLGITASGTSTIGFVKCIDLEISGCLRGLSDESRVVFPLVLDVEVHDCTGAGIRGSGGVQTGSMWVNVYSHNNANEGLYISTNNPASHVSCINCCFTGNGSYGFSFDASARHVAYRFNGCTFANNSNTGLYLPVGSTGSISPSLVDNVFYGNAGYGVVCGTLGSPLGNSRNAYGHNTSGDHSGWYDGDEKITLTATDDNGPFVDVKGNDFRPNAIANGGSTGGGLALRGAGSGGKDIGAVQHSDEYYGGASGSLTLSKETGANARGGSGTCAKLLPTSTTAYGHWTWFVPTDGTAFTLSFYYNCTSGFNGDIDVTIYDIDNATKLNDAEDVGETADGDWHQFTATQVDPSGTGLCRVVVSVKQGAHSAADVIYIDDIAVA